MIYFVQMAGPAGWRAAVTTIIPYNSVQPAAQSQSIRPHSQSRLDLNDGQCGGQAERTRPTTTHRHTRPAG